MHSLRDSRRGNSRKNKLRKKKMRKKLRNKLFSIVFFNFFFLRSSVHAERLLLEGRVAACSFLGSGVATRPYHTVCPTPIPVVCLSLVIRAAHTDLVRPLSFRSATLLASHFAFQVIRRPAAPIEFCRPHAPTGLDLDPSYYLELCFRSKA